MPSHRHVDATTLSPKAVLPLPFQAAENGEGGKVQKCADPGAPGGAPVCAKEANLPIFCRFHCRVNRPRGLRVEEVLLRPSRLVRVLFFLLMSSEFSRLVE